MRQLKNQFNLNLTKTNMKKILVTLSAAAIALGFASCKKEEQSKLDLSDFQGQAVVKGQVSYNSGYNKTGDVENFAFIKAAASTTVFWELKSGADVIEAGSTTTDANGMYSINFPATENRNLNANVFVSFEADKSSKEMDGDVAIIKTQKMLFNGSVSVGILKPNRNVVYDIVATGTAINPPLN